MKSSNTFLLIKLVDVTWNKFPRYIQLLAKILKSLVIRVPNVRNFKNSCAPLISKVTASVYFFFTFP